MNNKKILFISYILIIFWICVFTLSCGKGKFHYHGKRIIVLGIDGMDPNLLQDFVDQDLMPNFARLIAEGSFSKLTTSQPPQSPVAWSNFITGMDPGGHGIFDFIHRDPLTRIPYLSTSRMEPASKILKLGKYRIPLKSGKARLLRQGTAFWEILEQNGIPSVVFKIPANFPPVECKAKTFSGMGAPDILGTYGIFTFFTDDSTLYKEDIGGGRVTLVDIIDGEVKSEIMGPHNSLIKDEPIATAPLTIYRDPYQDVIRILVGGNDFILQKGEWSDWAEVKFKLLSSFVTTEGIVRFFLKQVHPHLELYCSPVNLAPGKPALPLSTPPNYSSELYRNLGNFYTLGIPEDTKALSAGYLDYGEYISQADLILEERLKELDYTWWNFHEGFYFFYFSTLDQNSHVLWATFDKQSPLYDPEIDAKYGEQLKHYYMRMDEVLAKIRSGMKPDDLLLIMSDHGFAPFRYCFDLNTWLLENGYITLKDSTRRMEEFFTGVNWRKTKSYGLGINSLYLNLENREDNGSVSPGREADSLKAELIRKLTSIIDPKTGQKVITSVWRREEIYHGPEMENAPDLIIGYNSGYRASWDTVLGKFPHHIISPNPDKWSGDHCMDNQCVPGVLLSNRKINKANPALYDLPATILYEFGIPIPDNMIGSSIF